MRPTPIRAAATRGGAERAGDTGRTDSGGAGAGEVGGPIPNGLGLGLGLLSLPLPVLALDALLLRSAGRRPLARGEGRGEVARGGLCMGG